MGGDIIGTDKGVYDVSTLHGCYSYLIRECNLPGRACEMVNKLYVMANIAELAAENTHSAPAAVDELIEALDKLVILQRHYADILNQYDGGNRKGFASADEWLDRLRALKAKDATARAEIVEEE